MGKGGRLSGTPALRTRSPGSGLLWGLALGYFLFYIPYSGLTKALSKGLLPGMSEQVAGLALLPVTLLAAAPALLLYLVVSGHGNHVRTRRLLGVPVIVPRAETVLSGLATATLIATTTLNYTFAGISIVFALLLMRGGVLILAPIMDACFGRPIRTHAWLALALAILAISVAFSASGGYALTLALGVNISLYLLGYVLRLRMMSGLAKSERRLANRRFFAEETFVAAQCLLLVPAALAFGIGTGPFALLRTGYTTLLFTQVGAVALVIGTLYAGLYICGSKIYLHPKANTYCVALNRCSSLLSGVVATIVLSAWRGAPLPGTAQLVAAGILVAALLALGLPSWARRHVREAPRRRVVLFVCNGNRTRSPVAQAICNGLSSTWAHDEHGPTTAVPVEALSAGLAIRPGGQMHPESRAALHALGITAHEHETRPLDRRLIDRADDIYCMTNDQCERLLAAHPEAAGRVHRIDPGGDVPEPDVTQHEVLAAFVERVRHLVATRVLPQPA